MIDKRRLNKLMQDLSEFSAKNLYQSDIHQITIDTVENFENELNYFGEEDYTPCLLEDMIGSFSYQVENLLEVCDKNLVDYSILKDLLKVLDNG